MGCGRIASGDRETAAASSYATTCTSCARTLSTLTGLAIVPLQRGTLSRSQKLSTVTTGLLCTPQHSGGRVAAALRVALASYDLHMQPSERLWESTHGLHCLLFTLPMAPEGERYACFRSSPHCGVSAVALLPPVHIGGHPFKTMPDNVLHELNASGRMV